MTSSQNTNGVPTPTTTTTIREDVSQTTTTTTKVSSNCKGCMLLDYCSLSQSEMIRLAHGTDTERAKAVQPISTLSVPKTTIQKIQSMTQWEHFCTVLFLLFGVPNAVVTIPLITIAIGYFVLDNVVLSIQVLLILLLPLILLPQPFIYERLHCWMAVQVVRYFSFRFVYEEPPQSVHRPTTTSSSSEHDDTSTKTTPQILVAPPHGVFPYGNLLAMLAWPSLCGNHFQGLAANSALRVPILKQILRSMGVIDASRESARRALLHYPYTIGISTGGVAEVFETNANDECILLKERIGLIKLAIRTGADLVPCYLFGNTRIMSCWAGEGIPYGRWYLEKLSRKVLGFALVFLYGRWYLPIPRRVPVLAVLGKPIATKHLQCDEPDSNILLHVQAQLIEAMQTLFDTHKHLYGWEDKHLIIK